MANNKVGFNYYSVLTNRYEDKKIKKLKREMGCAGLCVYDKILCEIYREEGCFIQWDEDSVFDVADYFALEETLVNEIVNYCCLIGLFNKELFERERVLSSLSIQSRFLEWSRISKRKNVKVPEKYVILPEESTKLPEGLGQNSGSLPQSKVKESKVKESKVKESKEDLRPPEKNEAPVISIKTENKKAQDAAPKNLKDSNLYRQPNIPTFEEVHLDFLQNGGTEQMARSFFDKNEAVGWFSRGSPIMNFKNLTYSYIENWKKNELNNKRTTSGKYHAGNSKQEAASSFLESSKLAYEAAKDEFDAGGTANSGT